MTCTFCGKRETAPGSNFCPACNRKLGPSADARFGIYCQESKPRSSKRWSTLIGVIVIIAVVLAIIALLK